MSVKRTDNPAIGANAAGPASSQGVMAGAAHMEVDAVGQAGPEAAASGDARSAWMLRLIEADGPGILRMLWRILGREQDVLDAYQDCFCKLAALAPDRQPRNARAYAYRTASNIAIELIRVRRRRAEHWDRVVSEHGAGDARAARSAAPEDRERLRQGIAQLPPHLRSVIVLRDLSRLPYEQVGRTLGIDPATARVYRRHAVVKLAELLGAED